MYSMANYNKAKADQTADPSKYPQGYFKDKPCRNCGTLFKPKAPSELYCNDYCKGVGIQDGYLMRNYGIKLSDYKRMLEEQDNKCAICKGPGFLIGTNNHKVLLVVDHCHTTGRVRGLLCHNCNRALGLLQDKQENVQRALDYLNV